jgi:hypothetical protein
VNGQFSTSSFLKGDYIKDERADALYRPLCMKSLAPKLTQVFIANAAAQS